MPDRVNILLTCIGRRVSLLQAFRKAMADLGLEGRLCGADVSGRAPAFHLADEGVLVPPVHDASYVDEVLKVCRERNIGLVVPLLDWELEALAEARERFAEVGARMLISSPRVVHICRDKVETFRFLKQAGLGTPELLDPEAAEGGAFPIFMKPRYGSNAKDVHKLNDAESVRFWRHRVDGAILQEYVFGDEFTVDVYAGLDGVPRIAVPRQRLVIRGGEVAKGQTVRHRRVIAESLQLVEALAECAGVITIQCFLTPDGDVRFIEVNPRFGGGVPLAIRAGADFPRWILEHHLGREPAIDPEAWEDGLLMLRYDAEVFCRAADVPGWAG